MMKRSKHEHGFKTPDDYFKSLEDRLDSLIDQESLPEDSGLKAPQGYFDELEDRIVARLNQSPAPSEEGRVIPLHQNRFIRIVVGAAAIVVLMILVLRPESDPQDDFQNIDMAQIEDYVEEQMLWDEYDLVPLMEDSELEELDTQDLFDNDDLQEYLLENIDDTSLLIE